MGCIKACFEKDWPFEEDAVSCEMCQWQDNNASEDTLRPLRDWHSMCEKQAAEIDRLKAELEEAHRRVLNMGDTIIMCLRKAEQAESRAAKAMEVVGMCVDRLDELNPTPSVYENPHEEVWAVNAQYECCGEMVEDGHREDCALIHGQAIMGEDK